MNASITLVVLSTLMICGCEEKSYNISLQNETGREIAGSNFRIGDYTGTTFSLQAGSGRRVQLVPGVRAPKEVTIYWTYENGKSHLAIIDIVEDLPPNGYVIEFSIVDDKTVNYEVVYYP